MKMLPNLRNFLDKILFICQNTGVFNTTYCSLVKMHHSKWRELKTSLLSMSLEERRKRYSVQDYMTVDKVDPWCNYVIRHKGIEAKKHTLDDLTEFKKFKLNNSLNKKLSQKVSIYKGDITQLEVGAIVNAANSLLKAGGGVDGAIHRAAGRQLQDECETLGGCPTGEAKITCGYGLPARYVIHTVGPQDGSPDMLQRCYENCLAFIKRDDVNTIAFPCISTGIYGFPNRLAAHIALRATRKHLEQNEEDVERVIFCTFLPVDVDIYETLMQMYFPVHEWNYSDGASTTE